MTEKNEWTLGEIRSAYGDILRAYNLLFPLHRERKTDCENMTGSFDKGDDCLINAFRKTKEIVPKLKQAADQSGNAVVWHCGDPLEGLNQKMRERVEKALRLGI